jgi:hypothetical protein
MNEKCVVLSPNWSTYEAKSLFSSQGPMTYNENELRKLDSLATDLFVN